MDNGNIVSVLNNLIQTCKDGEQGFRTAAENLKNQQTKALFSGYAQERAEMAQELQAEVRAHGGAPESTGSIAGSTHRGWMNLKAAVAGGDDSIIAEAERGEDVAKKAYDDALAKGLPPMTLAIVRKQAKRVHDAHDQVRALEKATARH
jgi:uncharacterized protein (TIGR02284 family)